MNDRFILVAEDDTASSKVLLYAFTNAGFDVTLVTNGCEAWEAAQIMRFDLIITDYQMPHLSGGELCELLRKSESYSDTPIILVTGKCLELDVQQIQNDYALSAVFQKPFSPSDLVRVAEQCILRHNLSNAPSEFLVEPVLSVIPQA
jgi:CheY-like chemotaxis protein